MTLRILTLLTLSLTFVLEIFGQQPVPHRAAWMKDARWGVMTHYLADWIARDAKEAMTVEGWNKLIDGFDVETLAGQLQSVGAGYYIITLGQNSGYYLSPNATYDQIVGTTPSKLSKRDLILDLDKALSKRGIKLILYLPSGAPNGDKAAVAKLEWKNGPHRNREFQMKWEQIIREWSTRYGTKIAGWWFDGCYWPNTMYRTGEKPDFASFAAAARAGNSVNALAFNPGIVPRIISMTPQEDYTAGEINDFPTLSIRRTVDGILDGAQVQVLSYLGQTWGTGAPRFSAEEAVKWSREVAKHGGVITWDIPVARNGTISPAFLDQAKAVGAALGKK